MHFLWSCRRKDCCINKLLYSYPVHPYLLLLYGTVTTVVQWRHCKSLSTGYNDDILKRCPFLSLRWSRMLTGRIRPTPWRWAHAPPCQSCSRHTSWRSSAGNSIYLIFFPYFLFLLEYNVVYLDQCCGSGSARIHIYFCRLDPDPHWEYGSGSRRGKI